MNPLAQKILARLEFRESIPMNEYEEKGRVDENTRLLPIIRELLSLVESQREALAFAKPYHQGGHSKVGRLIDTALTHTDEVLKRLGSDE